MNCEQIYIGVLGSDQSEHHYNERQKIRTISLDLQKKEEECQIVIFYFVRCVHQFALYSDVIHSFDWKSAIEHDGGV